ncbi:MAG: pilus assembly protein PilZ [Burkholderiaceae bacterium]|nr:pilus assembly protein PilZ [Burkholderiaceae bacterium]
MSEQQGEVATQTTPAPAVRPSVLSLAIRERSALYSAYMPFLKNGGIFVPTSRPFKIGDEVFLLLDLMDEPAKFQIAGTIVWVTPAGASHGKVQGIGIHFPEDETGTRVRLTIEKHLGSALTSSRPTHTL